MTTRRDPESNPIGGMPYRLALAGGWIDQPFMSRHNPDSFGSMVVVSVEPTFWFMERAGLATSTRNTAFNLWGGRLPDRPPAELVRQLYEEENRHKDDPSGSQDMAGIVYPGISRLDYDVDHEGGVFPRHVESTNDPEIAAWLQGVIHILPVNQRPARVRSARRGRTLCIRSGSSAWTRSSADGYEAILKRERPRSAPPERHHDVLRPSSPASITHLRPPRHPRTPGPVLRRRFSGCLADTCTSSSEDHVPALFSRHMPAPGLNPA